MLDGRDERLRFLGIDGVTAAMVLKLIPERLKSQPVFTGCMISTPHCGKATEGHMGMWKTVYEASIFQRGHCKALFGKYREIGKSLCIEMQKSCI